MSPIRTEVTEKVEIELLALAESPRLDGEVREHTLRLAESDAVFPPILVHRPTMRVLDGVHRLHAMALRGHAEVEVEYVDGSIEDAFVLAVQANVAHGLPLSVADRKAAATRILRTHPGWSDRSIAQVTGLSAKTIRGLRCSTVKDPQLHVRTGLDGRVRPLRSAPGRRKAAEILARRPNASLREVARAAGISPGTVRDVRNRLQRGDDPVPEPRQRRRRTHPADVLPGPDRVLDAARMLHGLTKDPSLRMTESGRELLRWLHRAHVELTEYGRVLDAVPEHCLHVVVELAVLYAATWERIAARARGRSEMAWSRSGHHSMDGSEREAM